MAQTWSDEARAKQAQMMRERWRDPDYRAKVAAGRGVNRKLKLSQGEVLLQRDAADAVLSLSICRTGKVNWHFLKLSPEDAKQLIAELALALP